MSDYSFGLDFGYSCDVTAVFRLVGPTAYLVFSGPWPLWEARNRRQRKTSRTVWGRRR